ncbi:MAG TPA: indolepyruvate ferredoxin oxidoreductase subunit alpha [Prolixibacteraceae bacterium]|nr:indolepyruvate ferredoxin oxidoreductase subunit alpha [Prolixibacteraceae bacterium]
MQKNLLLGVEAIAQGAIDGGISGVYAYPGTPSTEITEYIQVHPEAISRGIHRSWSVNEKTAYEAALGMSYTGKRALVCMKHVGLNVAADPFMNSCVTGINGGLVLAVADDPSMHSSQNEQDSRFYGKFGTVPVLEPSNQQEAYDMVYEGLELSEALKLPVVLRVTTRLAHSRSGVERRPLKNENALALPANPKQFLLLPAFARRYYQALLAKQPEMVKRSEESPWNFTTGGKDYSLGIICCGLTYNYLMENYPGGSCPYPVLKVSQYPLPEERIRELGRKCEELLVLEEGFPLVEEQLTDFFGKGTPVMGRLSGALPRAGELNPDHVARALGREVKAGLPVPGVVANRPPALCQGCGHQDVYTALNEALEEVGHGRVFSDIGCYTLGALQPYNSIDTCVDMGASVTMAKGASDAGWRPAFAVIGDSTFTHSGITGLLDCVVEKSDVTVIILDNEAVAMTGGQDSQARGRIEDICAGVGVDPAHIRLVVPLKKNHDEMVAIIREEMAWNGVSVIIARRPCIQKIAREKREKKN